MKYDNKKIIIATGGTGGHIFPSLSLAEFFNSKYQVEIVTDQRGLKYLNNYKKSNIKIINSGTVFKKNILGVFLGITKVIYSFISSIFLIVKSRPKLVIGMGGYSSFPICVAAYFLRIPIIIYENNLIIGKANKFLLPIVKKILVSTNDIKGISSKYTKKIFLSGYLIRNHILHLKKDKIELSDEKNLSILIMGGSQSAKIFGELLPNIIVKCLKSGIKIRIYQQCLDNQIDKINKIYKEAKLDFDLFSFTDDISKYYKVADLAITRSGASSLAELINLRIPFIAVPLPSAADNHQFINANYFKEKGYCFLLEERFVSAKLFEMIKNLKTDEKKLFLIKKKMSEHSDIDAFYKVETLIEKIINE